MISWIIFGIVVGLIAKAVHPKDEPIGMLSTIAVGMAGSFIGGFISWILDFGRHSYHPSGFFMSIIGGIIFCMFLRYYMLKTSPSGPKSFFNGKKIIR
jgi:uncharacterized membrane protein YeaQ/YmgE (transglycosylase-associated protein family)